MWLSDCVLANEREAKNGVSLNGDIFPYPTLSSCWLECMHIAGAGASIPDPKMTLEKEAIHS